MAEKEPALCMSHRFSMRANYTVKSKLYNYFLKKLVSINRMLYDAITSFYDGLVDRKLTFVTR